VVICLERGADLHVAQLMTLPLTVSCFSKIQIGFTFLVPAHPGSPGKRAVKRVQFSGSSCYKGRCLASTDALLQARWRVVRHFQHSSDDTRLLGSDCRWPSYAERQHFICRFNYNITNRAYKCVLAVAGRYT